MAWRTMKKYVIALSLCLLFTRLSYGVTWTVGTTSAAIANFTGASKNVTVNLAISRDNSTTATSYYLLISGASLGLFSVGDRKVYKDNAIDLSSVKILVCPGGSSNEISVLNNSTAIEASGSMTVGQLTKNIAIKFITGTGPVPAGVYANVFNFQLYVGAAAAPNGIKELGAEGSISVTVTSTVSNTMDITFTSPAINFGDALAADQSYTASTTMKLTAPKGFSLSAFSDNLGKLVLPSGESFNYQFSFAGAVKSLSSGIVSLISNGAAVTNKSYALSFTTEVLGFIEPGMYSDMLTFVFTSQ